MSYSYVQYTGNGTLANYTFPFQYLSADHVKVKVDGVPAIYSLLNANTVTITPTPALNSIIEIRRVTPKDTNIVDFTDGSVLLERDLDLLATFGLFIAQEAADAVEDTISVDALGRWNGKGRRLGNIAPAVTPDEVVIKGTLDYEYPAVALVASEKENIAIVGSDLGATTTGNTDLGSITDPIDTTPSEGSSRIVTVATNIDDVIAVADNIEAIQAASVNASGAAASAAAAADSASDAADSATAASGSASAASASAANASTLATAAEGSATAAAGSATTASTAATTATTQATNAANSATSAGTSATNAASSASASSTSASEAAASAAAAAASFDSFDDRYLGAKASDPSVDNDGNPLLEGALYWNSVTNEFRAWNGSSWSGFTGLPAVSGQSGKFLSTNGSTTLWATVPDPQPATPTNDGLVYGVTDDDALVTYTGWPDTYSMTDSDVGGRWSEITSTSILDVIPYSPSNITTLISVASPGDPIYVTYLGTTYYLGTFINGNTTNTTGGGRYVTVNYNNAGGSGFTSNAQGATYVFSSPSSGSNANVSLGYGSNNSNGGANTSLGYGAGSTITTGFNLTVVGYDAEPSSPTATNEVTLGNSAVTKTRLFGALAINDQTGTTGQVLTSNGTGAPTWQSPPASITSVDGAIIVDGTVTSDKINDILDFGVL